MHKAINNDAAAICWRKTNGNLYENWADLPTVNRKYLRWKICRQLVVNCGQFNEIFRHDVRHCIGFCGFRIATQEMNRQGTAQFKFQFLQSNVMIRVSNESLSAVSVNSVSANLENVFFHFDDLMLGVCIVCDVHEVRNFWWIELFIFRRNE